MMSAALPLARAVGVALVVTGAIMAALTAALPVHHVLWVVRPLLGFDVARIVQAAWGLGLVLAGLLFFYRIHCVGRQPWWANILGWPLVCAGGVFQAVQGVLATQSLVTVDINHWLWSIGDIEFGVGAYFVVISAWRHPDAFVPYARRLATFALVAFIGVSGLLGGDGIGDLYVAWALLALAGFALLLTPIFRSPDRVPAQRVC
jgi:hypothetical protein